MEGISPSNPDSISPEKSVSRQMGSVRQPVSCEPCRRRKIKCSKTIAPCDTCRRRGCADHCIYKGSRDESSSITSIAPNRELLDRISNLETLLKKHTGAHIPFSTSDATHTSTMLSPPMEYAQPFHTSPGSFTSENSSHHSYSPDRSAGGSHGVGVLASSLNGNVRYEPRSSQWTSVLANTKLSTTTPSLEDQDDPSVLASGFPFISSIPSMDELLSVLPPMQQCDYLKNTYFTVFSPVSCPHLFDLYHDADACKLFHILHEPTFHAQYAQFLDDPSSVPVSWLAILFILLSLAVTALEESDPVLRDLARGPSACNNIRLLSRRYREAAMKCLAKQGVFWGKHNVQSLQALIMLVYAMGHSQDPTWVLLGKSSFIHSTLLRPPPKTRMTSSYF
jgi:hypothetical protein